MLKKSLAWLLTLCLVLSGLPMTVFAADDGAIIVTESSDASAEAPEKSDESAKTEAVEAEKTVETEAVETEAVVKAETESVKDEAKAETVTETPENGYMLYIYNADDTVGMEINGTKSDSAFCLRTAIEDARVFVDNAFLFGITTPATYVVEMYEDSTEDESFEIGSDVTINGNGHKIVCAEGVTVTNKGTFNNVTVTESAPAVTEITTINTVDDLKDFRDSVNGGNSYEDKTVTLANNLDLTGIEWTPIGNGTRSSKSYTGAAFKGTFDGGDHTISGLTITSTTGDDAAVGLFGVVDGGTVKDLTLDNVNINVTNSDLAGGAIGMMVGGATAENITVGGSVIGHDGVGGIVGRLIISGTIEDCINNADVTSSYGGIGGIVGKAYYEDGSNTDVFASITDCTNNGTITAPMYVGGIVGLARANVTGCTNNGAVVGGTQTGGIIGQLIAAGTVSGNENKAKITGKNHMGGIIGDYTQSTAYTYFNVTIKDNINRGELEATEQCAAIMGCNNIDGFTDMTATGNVSYYHVDGLELFGNPEDMVIDDTNKFVVEATAVAKVGETEYTDLQEAIVAAAPNGTVEILSDIVVDEWVMIAESLSIGNGDIITCVLDGLTINGNGHKLTINSIESAGNGARMFFDATELNIKDLTINLCDSASGIGLQSGMLSNITFNGGVYGVIPQAGEITITGCTFATTGTAIYYEAERDNLTVTGCTFNQPEGVNVILLRGATKFTNNTVSSGRTVNVVSGSPVVTGNDFNDVRLKVYNGATATITNNEINNLVFNDTSVQQSTFTDNTLSEAAQEALDAVTAKTATVAKIGNTEYATLAEAVADANDEATITLIWEDGDAPIAMNGAVYGKSVTITGTATVDWSKGFLFVGRGGEGNGTVIFDNATLTSASDNASYGIHVSGREKDTTNKYDGTLVINNSEIELDYLINKGTMTLDNSTLTVKNGFSIGGRPASETESGEDATATLTLNNGSKVIVNNHNGMGLGYEAIGVMNVNNGSTFECTQDFLVTAKGTMNVNGGTVDVDGTLTNNGEVKLTDVSLTDAVIDGSGTTRFYNTINLYGDNSITSGINGTPFELIVNEGATLLITRFVLGYNRNITVNGEIEDVHGFDPTGKTPSLKFNSTSGVSVGGTGTGNLTVKNAYVELDSSSWKNAQGTYNWSFKNSYVSATSFTNCNEPSTDAATWTVTFDDSVLAAKNYIKNGVGTTYNFTNGSVATTGSLRIDGVMNIDETSSVTTTAQQNNKVGAVDEHGGINGTVNVKGNLTIGSNANTQLELLGGTLNVNGGNVALGNNTLTLDAASELTSSGNISGAITAEDGAKLKITGGTYTQDVTAWCIEGCECVDNGDGTYGVKALPVAKVGNTEYTSIDEAIAAWTNGTTLTLLANVTLSDVFAFPSTESRTLDLGTYTLTAAEGKHAIEITCNGQSTATYGLTVKADAENPGGITATGKSCIYYRKSGTTKDRVIIRVDGGVFNGSYAINVYSSNRGTNCPQVSINGGTFNGNVNIGHGKLIASGGTFNGWVNCTGDSTAYRQISGGKYKSWQFMTADAPNKFWVGTSQANYNVGVYVDDNGYLVVGGPVITEPGTTFEASSTNYSGWSSYLKYSSAATNALYYTSVEEALADNNKTTGAVTIYVDELDLTSLNFKGTLKIEDGLTVTFAEGTTPAWTVAATVDDKVATYTDSVDDGVVTRTYKLITPVAKIGDVYYETFAEAVAAVSEGETIQLLAGTIEEETVKLPASLNNVTIKGADNHASILKDMTVMAADGNSISYYGLTFDGIAFENSRISITGWRNNGAVVKNLTVTNCIFKNLDDTTNSAPVHINMDATEAVENFTFTNNVIDGATGGSKSGVYAQTTGKTVFTGNTINNVAFRPYVIQLTTDDGVADEFIVTGNTFSGSAAGRAQGLGNNDEGTDTVKLVVNNNIFKDITNAQQICYWNFNSETTTADLSKNYYDIDIEANPNRIYFNSACQNNNDLIAAGMTSYYTELKADGTVNTESLVYVKALAASITDVNGNVTYYETFVAAVKAAQAGDTITLMADIHNLDEQGYFEIDKNYVTIDGNGHTISGKSRIIFSGYGNAERDYTVKNVIFKDITDSYSPIHCNSLGGKLTVTGCTFDNIAWDGIQVASPVDGAKVEITNNVFKGTCKRHIHIQPAIAGAKMDIAIEDNKFYEGTGTTIGIWYATIESNIDIKKNYVFDASTIAIQLVDDSETVNSTELALPLYDEVLATEIVYVAKINTSTSRSNFYTTLADAIAAAEAGETVTLVMNTTLDATIAIEKAITLDLNGKTVTGADGAIVFDVKAATTIKNGTILGNKSGTSSGLIDIYADLTLNGVTVETSKIIALRFKTGDCTATLTNCNVTGQFKGYGGSVWNIVSGTYKASSTAISDQLNGTASVSGGTFYYAIDDVDCAPGYAVVDNGDGTYGVKYAPVGFIDANNNGTKDDGEVEFGSLKAVFDTYQTGDVYIVLTANTSIATQVDTDADAKYYLNTNVAEGVTVEFAYADNWNYVQKMYIGKNVTVKAPYFLAWTELVVDGAIITDYAYFLGAKVTVNEGASIIAKTGDATVQVKDNTVLTVNGIVETAILNVWVNASKLIVNGENAEVNASWIDIWDGTPSVTVENGATLDVDSIKASRGGSIAVTDATLDATTIEIGHNGESAGKLTESGNSTINGAIKLTATGSTVASDGELTVTTNIADHKVVYENGEYKVVPMVYVAQIGETKFESLQAAVDAAAQTGDTITILADQHYTNLYYDETKIGKGDATGIMIAGKDITIDLNGYKISGECDATKHYQFITVAKDAKLTVCDTSTAQTGEITYKGTVAPDAEFMYAAYTIRNQGTLVLDSGLINNTTEYKTVSVTVNNEASESLGHLYVNGGEIRSNGIHWGVRVYVNNFNINSKTVINGGKVGGVSVSDARWTDTACKIDLTIGADATIVAPKTNAINFTSIQKNRDIDLSISISDDATIQGTITGGVAKIGDKYFVTVTEAINAATDGATVQLLAGTISEVIAPWATDSTHVSEKSITIVGAENFGTTLTGGLFLGYDDSGCRAHTITIKGIAFEGKGILVAGQQKVVIEGNKFSNITACVATSQSANENAISIIGKNVNATVTGNVIDTTTAGGIHLRDVASATVTGNTVSSVQDNAITINPTAGSNGIITVEDNTLTNWGLGGEGRAMRISGGAAVNVNGNVMTNASAPEEFAKITGATTVDASKNYWNGVSPMADGMFATDIAGDPAVNVLKNYYTDAEKTNLVDIPASVATIDGTYYTTLAAAFAAAADGDVVTVLDNIATSESATVAAGKAITLELAGKTIEGTDTTEKNYGLIQNNGTLTIKDSVGGGKITLTATTNSGWNRYSAVISNNPGGTLVVNGGTIEHLGGTDMAYGIDSLTNGGIGDVSVTINGGTVASSYRAIRQFLNSDSKQNVLTINGGEIKGVNKAIFFHDPSTKANNGTITIGDNATVYGGVYLYVTEGSTEWPVNVSISGTAVANNVTSANVPAGLVVKKNDQGNYTVEEVEGVAQIDGVGYETVAEALAAAKSGDTVKLIKDATEGYVMVTPGVTLDLNGYALTASYVMGFNGSNVIDSSTDNTGLLKAAKDSVKLDESNAQLPVWNGNDGYVFYDGVFARSGVSTSNTNVDKMRYQFMLSDSLKAVLTNGSTDNNFNVLAIVEWIGGNNRPQTLTFMFTEADLIGYATNGGILYVDITGLSENGVPKFTNLNVRATIESGTGVTIGSEVKYHADFIG